MQTTSHGPMENLRRILGLNRNRQPRGRPRTGDRRRMLVRTTTVERWKREAAERVAWGLAHPKPERKSRAGKRPNSRQKRRARYWGAIESAKDDPTRLFRIMGLEKQRFRLRNVAVVIGGVRVMGFDGDGSFSVNRRSEL